MLEICCLVNERPLGLVTKDKEGIADTLNISPNQLVFGRSKKTLPTNLKMKNVIEGGLYNAAQAYSNRSKVINLFWNQFISGYKSKLKFTDKWMSRFKADIPKNQYVLLQEKNLKPGRFIPAVVVDVHRRKDGLISRLKLKTTEHKGIVERNIRACFMLEHDYLMLTEKVHQCILQDLEGDDSKMTCALPVSHLMYNNIEEEEFGLKKGEEQVFSTQKYVPK